MLFPVFQFHPDTVFLMQMFGHMLCRIDRTMLSACASEADHQMRKATFQITFYRSIHQCLHMLQESRNFTVLFQKTDNRFIPSRQCLVCIIAAGIMDSPSIEYKTAAVIRLVLRNSFAIRETHHRNRQLFPVQGGGKLWQPAQIQQKLVQIGIFLERLLQ